MLEHDKKKTSIYDLPRNGKWEYEYVGPSDFSLPFSNDMADEIVHYYQQYAGGPARNDGAICLHRIEERGDGSAKVLLASCCFYDFLLANVIGREAQDPKDKIIDDIAALGAPDAVLDAIALLGRRFRETKASIRSFRDCLESPYLPNMVAISTLVHDREGSYLVSQRTDNVIIGKRMGGVTSTGTLDFKDVVTGPGAPAGLDPFCRCAKRELSEESALSLPLERFDTRGMFIGKAKLQPISIVDCEIEEPLSGYVSSDPRGTEPDEPELKQIRAIPRSDIQRLVFNYDMTEAASYHLLLHAYDGNDPLVYDEQESERD